MPEKTEVKKTKAQYRYFSLSRDAVDVENRTVQLAFSSDEPYERYFGKEILDHTPKSVRLDRLKNGGALLLDHDTTRHIGVVQQADIDNDQVGRASVRFGRSAEAESAFQDVQDGIRQHVSVGYLIHRMEMEEKNDGQETYRVTDWEPIEISLVAIPADPTVGIGRAGDAEEVSTEIVRRVADETPTIRIENMPPEIDQEAQRQAEAAARQGGQEAERARVKELSDMGEQYSKYLSQKDIADAIRNGRSAEQFRETIMQKMSAKHSDAREQHVGLDDKDIMQYSIARAVRAHITGNWTDAGLERACSEAVEKRMGKAPEGFYVPLDAFRRDFNVGTSSEAGNLVATILRDDLFTDVLRNALCMGKLGARFLSGLTGNIAIPRKSVASTLAMQSEIGALSESNPNTALPTLSPKRLGSYVEYSKQALIQSALALEAMLRDDLLSGAAVLLESQVINGSGTAPNIKGILNQSGIGSVVGGTNGANVGWANIVGLESACANVNAEPDSVAGYLINTKMRGSLKTTTKGTYLGFIWDNGDTPLNGYKAAVSNNVPSNLTKGTSTTVCSAALFASDWSMLVIGLFGAPDITVDPYSLATTGQVRITLNQFADANLRQPGAFAASSDLLTP